MLETPKDDQGDTQSTSNPNLTRFSGAVEAKLNRVKEIVHVKSDPGDKLHSDITTAIQFVIETNLPAVERHKRQRHKVYHHFKNLMTERSKDKCHTAKQVDDL